MVVDSWREKGEGGENNGETSLGNTFSNFTRGKYTPQNPVYNNKHDQGGIHGDNLNSNSDAGEELSRISEDGVIVVDPKRRRISQEIRKTSGKSPLLIMLHVLPVTCQKIE